MRTRKFLLNIDLVFQTILLFLAVVSSVVTIATKGETAIVLGYALLFLGFWQLGSGLIMGIIFKDRKRAEYFLGSILYLGAISFIGSLNPISIDIINKILAFVFIAIIPLGIAYWYLRLTKLTIEELEAKVEIPEEMKSILDSEEIFKPIER